MNNITTKITLICGHDFETVYLDYTRSKDQLSI